MWKNIVKIVMYLFKMGDVIFVIVTQRHWNNLSKRI